MKLPSRTMRTTALVLVVILLTAAGLYLVLRPAGRTVTAYFPSATALYVGNPVKVLGVPVGTVADVAPEPERVRVVLHLREDVKVPAEVHAAQVSPSLISGRYVALTPRYRGGPRLADGAVIPRSRTQVPLNVNDLYRNAEKLATALGPQGANKHGSLSDALRVAAENLRGNGDKLATMIEKLADSAGTLSGSRQSLAGTVDQLSTFVDTLAKSDGDVRTLNKRLATVLGFLSDDRDELGAALRELSTALGEVSTFVHDNRAALKSNVDKLTEVTEVLVKQRAELGQVLDEAPTGLSNLLKAYDSAGATLDVRAVVNELRSPSLLLVCKLAQRSTPQGVPKALTDACSQVGKYVTGALPLPTTDQIITALQGDELPPVPGLGTSESQGGR